MHKWSFKLPSRKHVCHFAVEKLYRHRTLHTFSDEAMKLAK